MAYFFVTHADDTSAVTARLFKHGRDDAELRDHFQNKRDPDEKWFYVLPAAVKPLIIKERRDGNTINLWFYVSIDENNLPDVLIHQMFFDVEEKADDNG